jgi:hypothetical protein
MANAFAAITKSVSEATPKSATKKIQASVTPAIKSAVDSFVANKASIKALEARQIETETTIITHVKAQQDSQAFNGNFSKSFLVPGNNTEVTYVTSDRFSVPQDEETLAGLKKLIGATKFNEFFGSKPSIVIKSTVIANDAIMNKIAAACEKAGLNIGEIFEATTKVFAKDDLDIKQYSLPKEKLPLFRTFVRQNKPALK